MRFDFQAIRVTWKYFSNFSPENTILNVCEGMYIYLSFPNLTIKQLVKGK